MGIKRKGKRILSEEKRRGSQRRGRDNLSYKAMGGEVSIPDQNARALTQLQHAFGNTYIKKVMAKFATEVNGNQGNKKRKVYRRTLQDFHSLIQQQRILTQINKGKIIIRPVHYKYYRVVGNTLKEVHGKLNPIEWGRCNWHYDYKYSHKNGVIVSVDVTLTLTIKLPEWVKRRKTSTAAKKEWDRMLKYLIIHEQGHVDIAKKWAPVLQKRLLGQPKERHKAIWNKFIQDVQEEQDKYDEDTKHGQTQGVYLDLSVE